MITHDRIRSVAVKAAREAAGILNQRFGSAKVHMKSTQNLVTQADIESEEAITAIILQEFPDHRVLREEGDSTGQPNDENLWVIDPLDATNNYAHGIPHFAVSIAYAKRGEVQVGVVLDPVRDELFSAVACNGARLNERPIHASTRTGLEQSIVATGFYYDRGEMMERTLESVRRLFEKNIRGLRRMGSAALDLSWVACGRFEGFFEYELAPWDYAAGSLLVREAGGICLDRLGSPLRLNAGSVVAACPTVMEPLLEEVKWRSDAS